MKILALDTTNSTLSVAVLSGTSLLSQKNIFENNKHSELLIPVIEECLNQAKIWYQDLDLIAFTNGPGSFTGIRVGYSCAKALAISTNLPVFALSSLEAIAYSYLQELRNGIGKILVVNDARLEEFFIQEFVLENDCLKASFEPMMIGALELKNFLPDEKFLLAGSAKNIIKDQIKNAVILQKEDFIDAKNIALLAMENYRKQEGSVQNQALYIRKPKISERKRNV
jgi:tRNA threonylcarbamoyladenosine biosynthesis protein TsaB